MISAWTKHLKTEEEKIQFKNEVLGSKNVLKRLTDLLAEMEEDLNRSELSAKNYDSPNWAPKQAHVNGQKAQIRTIKFILNLDQRETND
jgi:hypothetical protein